MRMNVGTKLLGGFALILLFAALAGVSAVGALGRANDSLKQIYSHEIVGLRDLNTTGTDILSAYGAARDTLIATSAVEQLRAEQALGAIDARLERDFERLRGRLASARTRAAQDGLERAWSEFRSERDRLRSVRDAGDRRASLPALTRSLAPVEEGLRRFADAKATVAADTVEDAQSAVTRARLITLVLLIGGIVAGVAIAAALARSLVRRIRACSSFTERVAAGDLTARVEERGSDELEALARNLNAMAASLASISTRVMRGASTIGAGTSQMLSTVNQNAASASEQSATIQEISATLDEIRAAVIQTARKAEEVATHAEASRRAGEEGSEAVEAVVGRIEEIAAKVDEIAGDILALSEKTQQIGEITRTVNELADQSNMLALNAAIEAARAGEHGKGFAVVAEEVRNLAEQSQQATAQVHTILSDIERATTAAVMNAGQGTTVARSGTEFSRRAGEAIAELATTIEVAERAAQQIAVSTHEQTVGMDQIVDAMRDANQATALVATGARETETALATLDALARELRDAAGRYRLPEDAVAGNGGTPLLQLDPSE